MIASLRPLADAWIGRRAVPSAAALADVAGRAPATVVTGASAGIGLALARRFAAAGDTVLMIARHAEAVDAATAEVARQTGTRPIGLALDVTSATAAETIDAALAEHGLYLDVLVNNAGMGLAGPFAEHDAAAVERLLDLNVKALTRLMHHALPAMRARARGGVLNVASLGGYAPGPYQALYYASKAYVISLSEAVAAEVSGEGVRVAVVAPGPVDTGFHAAMGAEDAFYRFVLPSVSPARVAGAAYRGFVLGQRVIIPGLMSKLNATGMRILPHPALVPLVGWLLWPRRGGKGDPSTRAAQ